MNTARTVRAVQTEAGAILQNTENGAMFSTNLVGARVWQYLEKGATKDEITDRLSSEFGVARDQVSDDIDEFMNGLEQQGFLQRTVSIAQ